MGLKEMVFQQLKLYTVAALLITFSPELLAGDKENGMINKAVDAYGGESLRQLKSLKYTDKIKHFYQMQSGHSAQGPMTMHLSIQQIETTLDLVNKRKEFKRLSTRLVGNHDSKNLTTTHRIFADNKGLVIDHCLAQHQVLPRLNYNNVDPGFSQLLDPLIVKQLDRDRNQSRWIDQVYIQGNAHDVLTVNEGTGQEYTLYLNQNNGHLSRMTKHRGNQLRSYDFLDHTEEQGITWARQMLVSTDKQPIYYTDSRQLSINQLQKSDFSIPVSYQSVQPPQTFDGSQLTIRNLAKGVYFVGQGWGYTLFVDTGEYYVSAGAWGVENNAKSWQQAVDLLRQTTGTQKPIAQHIVSHHHTDHMSALRDVVAQGANLIIHPADIAAAKKHLKQPLADNRFIPIDATSYLADGKVMLFDVPNSHANHNLVLYLPEHQLIFTEDMFGSSFQKEFHSPNNWPSRDTYQRLKILVDKIKQHDLQVEQYVSSHHGRILRQTDIDKALKLSCRPTEELVKRMFYQR